MTKKERERRKRVIENNTYDNETKKYIMFMCSKGCKFYDEKCTKNRVVRVCAKQGLKNKE